MINIQELFNFYIYYLLLLLSRQCDLLITICNHILFGNVAVTELVSSKKRELPSSRSRPQ